MRYDLTSLAVFVAVAETSNLTRAAELQHLAVSAVSKRIAELERAVGAPLLQRHARGVSLTPAGRSMLHYARQILQLMTRMQGELSEYADGLKGVVRLHASTSALMQFLPFELNSFIRKYPNIRIQIEERTGVAIVRSVADGTAEIGVIGSFAHLPGLTAIPYRSDRLALAVPRGHPLARRKAVPFADALDHEFVGAHVESSLWALMTQAAKACNRVIEPKIQVSSFECICLLVEAGLGIAMLPERVIQSRLAGDRMVMVGLKDAWALREIQIVVKDLDSLTLTASALIHHLTESVAPD